MSSSGDKQNNINQPGNRHSTRKKYRNPSDKNTSSQNANIQPNSAQKSHRRSLRIRPIANRIINVNNVNMQDSVQDSEYKYIIPPPTTTFTCKYLKYEQPASKIKLINDLYATAYDKIYNNTTTKAH